MSENEIIPNDHVSWVDKSTKRRRFGVAVQSFPEYWRVRSGYGNRIYRIAKADLTKEVG